jgi:hypothetical protein
MMREKPGTNSWLFFTSKGGLCRTAKRVNWKRALREARRARNRETGRNVAFRIQNAGPLGRAGVSRENGTVPPNR